ncbi:hypothetical protein KAX03_02500, partial [Candidatus Bathyarchaeota archaeon]|nr:hypothetical protein [Candidatus Bathyarchaeota archaeon]
MKTSTKYSLQNVTENVFRESPLGLVKISALMKSAVLKSPIDEGQKNQLLFNLCRGFNDPKDYRKISPSLLSTMTQKEIITNASFNFSKCAIAKAMSTFFEKNVPKFKNLAARRKFLFNIANLSEILHKKSWQDLQTTLSRFEQEVIDDILKFADSLLKSKWTPETEVQKKLNESYSEYSEYIKTMEELTGINRETIDRFSEDYELVSFFDPWYMENEKTRYWGTVHYPILNVLNIQPSYLYFDVLRKGLVAREAARIFQHRALDKIDWIYEQSDYCATRLSLFTFFT